MQGTSGTSSPVYRKDILTILVTIGEPEPRRSVRATKGQHTKAFEALENGPQPSKRKQAGGKKGKKAAAKEEEEEDEEVIRCVCGAISQDNDDPNEPWIACEKCGSWQHNVCMGMSIFDDELPKEYFCEQCKPEDHAELLEGIEKGEEPWVTRRQKHEEDNKKKKGKKGKGKRVSDAKDRSSPAASNPKAKPSPTPEVKKEEPQEPAAKGKRKSRDQSQGPQSKLRKVSETQAAPVVPKYTPPADLPESMDKLEAPRRKVAQGLQKSLETAMDMAVKDHLFTIPKDATKKALAERHALEIERAVQDSHSQPAQAAQTFRSLVFNLKKNVPLAVRVFMRMLTPPALAAMTSDEMATEELQRETTELKAKADKQATLISDQGPRMRRTHKGEEIVENESFTTPTEEAPSVVRRQSVRDAVGDGVKSPSQGAHSTGDQNERGGKGPLRVDTQNAQHSPRQGDFDINKVFSAVRSPSVQHQRRPSAPAPSAGPGEDADVDRMLEDDGPDSPPYSPTENLDPDVVWQGQLTMSSLANFRAVARYVGGADLSKQSGVAWKDLIPLNLTVAGRIPEDKAVPYLCGLRYHNQVDLIITSLSLADASDAKAREGFVKVFNYFTSKQRYGVVGERKLANVRDTYLVPIPAGDQPLPEPIQNIEGHLIPQNRPEPLLLLLFVYRDEKLPQFPNEMALAQQTAAAAAQTPTPVMAGDRRHSSIAGPTWSPATPQGPAPHGGFPPHQSHTPIPPPVIPGQPAPPMPPVPQQPPSLTQAHPPPHAPQHQPPMPHHQAPPQHHAQHPPQGQLQPLPQQQMPTQPPLQHPAGLSGGPAGAPMAPVEMEAQQRAQAEGESKARQVLGPLFNSPTVTFLLPHAARMKEGEWMAVKRCLERDPQACQDLPLLSRLLTEEGNHARQNAQVAPGQVPPGAPRQNAQSPPPAHPQGPAASPGVVQTTLAAAAANLNNAPPPPPATAPQQQQHQQLAPQPQPQAQPVTAPPQPPAP